MTCRKMFIIFCCCRIGTSRVAAPEIVLYKGQYYIASLMPTLKGIQIARLKWVPLKR